MFKEGNIKTHFLMLIVAIIWGFSWAIGRILSLEISPMTGAWFRYLLTMIIFFIWFLTLRIKNKKIRWSIQYEHLKLHLSVTEILISLNFLENLSVIIIINF